MRATIYHLYGEIGVCRLIDDAEDRIYVGECRISKTGRVRILPQTLREPVAVFSRDVTVPPIKPEDHVRLTYQGIKRFRERLKEAVVPAGVPTVALRREARKAIEELELLLNRIGGPR